MESSAKKKAALLGMSHGAATHRLRKAILFRYVQVAGHDYCFQCGKLIEDIANLSIEHKEPWQQADDPVESFFDLDNIAFSHLSCNSAASTVWNKKYRTDQERKDAKAAMQRRYKGEMSPERRRKIRRSDYEKYGC